MLVGLLVLAVFFTGRLIHKWWLVIAVRRRGHRYGTRLLAIHKELSEEVKLIESARELGELSRERKHLLDRLERACIELKEIASWWDA
jgi:hypothetical protein